MFSDLAKRVLDALMTGRQLPHLPEYGQGLD